MFPPFIDRLPLSHFGKFADSRRLASPSKCTRLDLIMPLILASICFHFAPPPYISLPWGGEGGLVFFYWGGWGGHILWCGRGRWNLHLWKKKQSDLKSEDHKGALSLLFLKRKKKKNNRGAASPSVTLCEWQKLACFKINGRFWQKKSWKFCIFISKRG